MELEHTWVLRTNDDIHKVVVWEGQTILAGTLVAKDDQGIVVVDVDAQVAGANATFHQEVADTPILTDATTGRWEMRVQLEVLGWRTIALGPLVIKQGL